VKSRYDKAQKQDLKQGRNLTKKGAISQINFLIYPIFFIKCLILLSSLFSLSKKGYFCLNSPKVRVLNNGQKTSFCALNQPPTSHPSDVKFYKNACFCRDNAARCPKFD
jgi:hypothetical protein